MLMKIFKSNISDGILCFISSSLVAVVLFLFEGIKVLVLSTLNEYDRSRSSIGIAVQSYIFLLLLVGIILILYTVNNYNRTRIRDYAMFMVLGAEKRSIIRMVFEEYGVIYGISYMIGCAAGSFLLTFIQYIFRGQGIAMKLTVSLFFKVSGMVFLYMFSIFSVSVLINYLNLQNHSLSSLMKFKEKKGRVPSAKWSIAGIVAGSICLVAAILLFTWQPADYERVKYGIIFFLGSLYLFFTYGGYMILMQLKKRERWYERYLLRVKNLYYRFSENKNLIFLIFTVNLFVLIIVNVNIVEYSNLSSKYLWKYPYDYVWMTEQKNVGMIEDLTADLENETEIYSYVTLSANDGGEYVGISEASYKRLTGNELSLRQGELISLIEKSESDPDVIFQDDQIYLKEGEKIKNFRLRYEKNEILFIAQQPELIAVVVMNDNDFTAMDAVQEEKTALVLQKVSRDTQDQEVRAGKAARQFAASLYSKMSLMRQDRQQNMTTLIFYICLGIFLILCSMTVFAIKIWAEIPFMGIKYGFLKKIGMDEQEIQHNVKGELSVCLQIPVLLSAFAGGVVIIYIIQKAEAAIALKTLLLFISLIMIQEIYIAGLRSYGYCLVKRWIHKGGKDGGID